MRLLRPTAAVEDEGEKVDVDDAAAVVVVADCDDGGYDTDDGVREDGMESRRETPFRILLRCKICQGN